MKYRPDIIISVHPLMQHVPLRILRAKGLLQKIVFTTVVTDLSTCHPTWYVVTLLLNPFVVLFWRKLLSCDMKSKTLFSCCRFHKLVTRCYCPSNEVAKRAMKAGLQPSQIKVYGLPVRPSFVRPVRPKVCWPTLPFLLLGTFPIPFVCFWEGEGLSLFVRIHSLLWCVLYSSFGVFKVSLVRTLLS